MAVYPKCSRTSAYVKSQRLKRDPKIKARLDELREAFFDGYEMNAREIGAAFSDIARADMKDILNLNSCTLQDIDTIDGRLIKEIKSNGDGTFTVKLHDKIQALRSMATYKGMFKDPETDEQAAVLMRMLAEAEVGRMALKDMSVNEKSNKESK